MLANALMSHEAEYAQLRRVLKFTISEDDDSISLDKM